MASEQDSGLGSFFSSVLNVVGGVASEVRSVTDAASQGAYAAVGSAAREADRLARASANDYTPSCQEVADAYAAARERLHFLMEDHQLTAEQVQELRAQLLAAGGDTDRSPTGSILSCLGSVLNIPRSDGRCDILVGDQRLVVHFPTDLPDADCPEAFPGDMLQLRAVKFAGLGTINPLRLYESYREDDGIGAGNWFLLSYSRISLGIFAQDLESLGPLEDDRIPFERYLRSCGCEAQQSSLSGFNETEIFLRHFRGKRVIWKGRMVASVPVPGSRDIALHVIVGSTQAEPTQADEHEKTVEVHLDSTLVSEVKGWQLGQPVRFVGIIVEQGGIRRHHRVNGVEVERLE
eukprot:gnl/TRDRNA2_/TRDRNA2_204039_c0_seq1.p1 gnl/TRDRNA2_/TRDRNA2_204039_c0~~gnl/TRDRNA2_/TRDRNA2_204039_c0_seq1.p1  ORF type:complete len:349 (-),score=62.14 gnl/TRDRNA2_/TRDRNA2_204039_c0_seq1:89-1135(-)